MSPSVLTHPQNLVGAHIEGAAAAERFIEGLRRYLCSGLELAELMATSAAMSAERREPWQRGFAGVLQKHCQRAVDVAP